MANDNPKSVALSRTDILALIEQHRVKTNLSSEVTWSHFSASEMTAGERLNMAEDFLRSKGRSPASYESWSFVAEHAIISREMEMAARSEAELNAARAFDKHPNVGYAQRSWNNNLVNPLLTGGRNKMKELQLKTGSIDHGRVAAEPGKQTTHDTLPGSLTTANMTTFDAPQTSRFAALAKAQTAATTRPTNADTAKVEAKVEPVRQTNQSPEITTKLDISSAKPEVAPPPTQRVQQERTAPQPAAPMPKLNREAFAQERTVSADATPGSTKQSRPEMASHAPQRPLAGQRGRETEAKMATLEAEIAQLKGKLSHPYEQETVRGNGWTHRKHSDTRIGEMRAEAAVQIEQKAAQLERLSVASRLYRIAEHPKSTPKEAKMLRDLAGVVGTSKVVDPKVLNEISEVATDQRLALDRHMSHDDMMVRFSNGKERGNAAFTKQIQHLRLGNEQNPRAAFHQAAAMEMEYLSRTYMSGGQVDLKHLHGLQERTRDERTASLGTHIQSMHNLIEEERMKRLYPDWEERKRHGSPVMREWRQRNQEKREQAMVQREGVWNGLGQKVERKDNNLMVRNDRGVIRQQQDGKIAMGFAKGISQDERLAQLRLGARALREQGTKTMWVNPDKGELSDQTWKAARLEGLSVGNYRPSMQVQRETAKEIAQVEPMRIWRETKNEMQTSQGQQRAQAGEILAVLARDIGHDQKRLNSIAKQDPVMALEIQTMARAMELGRKRQQQRSMGQQAQGPKPMSAPQRQPAGLDIC